MRHLALLLAASLALTLTIGAIGGPAFSPIQPAYAADCVANNNLDETAQSFISRCRAGGINREFPGEMYGKTLKEIKDGSSAAHNKAWKLLNDNRFQK